MGHKRTVGRDDSLMALDGLFVKGRDGEIPIDVTGIVDADGIQTDWTLDPLLELHVKPPCLTPSGIARLGDPLGALPNENRVQYGTRSEQVAGQTTEEPSRLPLSFR